MVPKLSLEVGAGVGKLATGIWVDGAVGIKTLPLKTLFLTPTMIKSHNNK